MTVGENYAAVGRGIVLQSSGGSTTTSSASQAGKAVCQTGFGDLIMLGLGLITIFLILLAVYRGALAFSKYGSPRTEKKREGQEQLKGAGITIAGAFVPGMFAVILDQTGLVSLSCVNLSNVLMIMPPGII